MTPRLRLNRHDRNWTDLFKGTHSLRKLRILVDAELLESRSAGWSAQTVVAGLVTHESIEAFRYSDDGPPPGTPEVNCQTRIRVAKGWAVATPDPRGGDFTTHNVIWSDGTSTTLGGIFGNAVEVAAADTRTEAYGADPSGAATRRAADAVAANVAQTIKADIYITNREYLHRVTWPLAQGVTFCTPTDALALIGLYLRVQGEFVIWKDPAMKHPYRFNKGLFYWVGTREVLPAGWRWFAACVSHARANEAADLSYLGTAVFQRVARALRARDDLLRAVNCTQDNDVADDALTALDTCLLFLMGAVDATARIAHTVLGLPPEDAHQAGWQKQRWLSNVATRAPALSDVVAAGSDGLSTLTILRLLRNTVHGVGLQGLAVGRPGRRDATLVALPRGNSDRILAVVDQSGGRKAWGLRELLPGRLHAEPGILLEKLFPAAIQLLNDLMAATPVERLAHVSLRPEDSLPPPGENQPFGRRERESIRWQLGL